VGYKRVSSIDQNPARQLEGVELDRTFTGDDAPLSVLLLQVLGAFAQFQRMVIREAQREGIAIAKRNVVYKGRKKALTTENVATVLQRISAGDYKAQIARDLGVSRKTLYQYLKVAA
jgi:DNA invertase Pin-like site-specific DNA recombinase